MLALLQRGLHERSYQYDSTVAVLTKGLQYLVRSEAFLSTLKEILNLSVVTDMITNISLLQYENSSFAEVIKDVTKTEILVVLSAISVAIESSKLWHSVYNNPYHILHGLYFPTYFLGNKGKIRIDEERNLDYKEECKWGGNKEGGWG